MGGLGGKYFEEGGQDGKIVPWDDHDIRKDGNLNIVNDYIKGSSFEKKNSLGRKNNQNTNLGLKEDA